jgi:membrane protein
LPARADGSGSVVGAAGRLGGWAEHPAVALLVQVARGFQAHRGPVRAASLAYTSLLALVPLIALVLGISKALIRSQDDATLIEWIDRGLTTAVPQLRYLSESSAEDARADVLARLQEATSRIDGGALGFFGGLVLVSVAVSLLSAIEHALNDIWGVERGRRLAQRVVYYWAGVTLGPVLLFVSIGLTGTTAIDQALQWLPGATVIWSLLPFLMLGTGFTLLYWTMPNTRVPISAAALGGFAAGILFQGNNLLSVLYFSKVMSYSAVYGSLGAIPVLMFGIYVSWIIVLLGAEISHVAASPRREAPAVPEAFDARAELALGVARAATAAYLEGRGGASRDEIAEELGVPVAWVNASLELLCRAGILAGGEAPSPEEPARFLPVRPPSSISALEVLGAVRGDGTQHGTPSPTHLSPSVVEFFRRFDATLGRELGDVTLETLARGERTADAGADAGR